MKLNSPLGKNRVMKSVVAGLSVSASSAVHRRRAWVNKRDAVKQRAENRNPRGRDRELAWVAGSSMAALLAIVVVADARIEAASSSPHPNAEGVVDASGNLHVPDDYRTTYQLLGSWAVTSDQGQESKQLHVVY